jgi:hypothetical protein
LIFLDPDSKAAETFAEQRGDKGLVSEIRRTIQRARELRAEAMTASATCRFEVLAHSQSPIGHMKRVDGNTSDGRVIHLPYLPGVKRADTPYFEVRKSVNPVLFNAYSRSLDHILKESRPILS